MDSKLQVSLNFASRCAQRILVGRCATGFAVLLLHTGAEYKVQALHVAICPVYAVHRCVRSCVVMTGAGALAVVIGFLFP